MTIKYEYEVSKVNLRNIPSASKYISGYGSRGFKVVYTVKDSQDLLILFEREIAPKAKATKAKPKSE